MVADHLPPARTSIDTVSIGTSETAPPNHRLNCAGVVQASKTTPAGAAKVRVIVNPLVMSFFRW